MQLSCNNYTLGGENLPAISASDSTDASGITHISLVNIDAGKEQSVELNLGNLSFKNTSGKILTSSKLQNYNSFEQPNIISPAGFNGFKRNGSQLTVSLPPYSVVVLTLQ
jgi:alpha-N-arabinofuranosidase